RTDAQPFSSRTFLCINKGCRGAKSSRPCAGLAVKGWGLCLHRHLQLTAVELPWALKFERGGASPIRGWG
ncbi:MAG: hypothetical protein RXP86_11760, partial [Acidilobus sp.]